MSTNNGKQGELLKNVTMNNMFVGEKHLCIQQHTLLNTSVAAFREEILKQTGYSLYCEDDQRKPLSVDFPYSADAPSQFTTPI